MEAYRQSRRVGNTPSVSISQAREQAQRRDDSHDEQRQNRQQVRCAASVAMRNQHQRKGKEDRDCRNQLPSPPMPIQSHMPQPTWSGV